MTDRAFCNFQPVVKQRQGQERVFSPPAPPGSLQLLQKLWTTGLAQNGPRDCPVSLCLTIPPLTSPNLLPRVGVGRNAPEK